nr:FISUMP domain-containing protein [uncultured Draconibacterium sp.]
MSHRVLYTYKKTVETLYNFATIEDLRSVAPVGFRAARTEDIVNLLDYLGGLDVAGGKLKAVTGWSLPNTGATNEVGFKATPAGYRDELGAFAAELLENRIWIDNR